MCNPPPPTPQPTILSTSINLPLWQFSKAQRHQPRPMLLDLASLRDILWTAGIANSLIYCVERDERDGVYLKILHVLVVAYYLTNTPRYTVTRQIFNPCYSTKEGRRGNATSNLLCQVKRFGKHFHNCVLYTSPKERLAWMRNSKRHVRKRLLPVAKYYPGNSRREGVRQTTIIVSQFHCCLRDEGNSATGWSQP